MGRLLMLVLAVSAFVGCANVGMVLMRNPKGDLVECDYAKPNQPWGFSRLDSAGIAHRRIDACVEQYRAAGYTRVDGKL